MRLLQNAKKLRLYLTKAIVNLLRTVFNAPSFSLYKTTTTLSNHTALNRQVAKKQERKTSQIKRHEAREERIKVYRQIIEARGKKEKSALRVTNLINEKRQLKSNLIRKKAILFKLTNALQKEKTDANVSLFEFVNKLDDDSILDIISLSREAQRLTKVAGIRAHYIKTMNEIIQHKSVHIKESWECAKLTIPVTSEHSLSRIIFEDLYHI